MKNLLLGALLSSSAMFASFGHSVHHSSHVSHSSHSSSHSDGSHMSSSHPTMHSTSYEGTASHPYHQTANISRSHVSYNPVHKYYYYPIMNHHTKIYDTIRGTSQDDVQYKVNSYVDKEEPNWFGIACLAALIAGAIFWGSRIFKD